MYACLHCENSESFAGNQRFTWWGVERVYLDVNGEVQDWGDRDTEDSQSDGIEDVECSECGETAFYYDDEEELRQARSQHREQSDTGSRIVSWKTRLED